MLDISSSDSDFDEVFNTHFIGTSITPNFSKSLNDIHAGEKPLERPNTLAIRTDENFTYNCNAVSTKNIYR